MKIKLLQWRTQQENDLLMQRCSNQNENIETVTMIVAECSSNIGSICPFNEKDCGDNEAVALEMIKRGK